MKCPKCGKEGCKYLERENKIYRVGRKDRTKLIAISNKAGCKKCGWNGEM